ncbi:MAG: hypothetical protein K8R74_16910 [Bacteroidales bacterium]|nr:hypothetical protein [Bacteroidales bacterium]
MKKAFRILVVTAFILGGSLFMMAQPPHPNGGSTPGTSSTPIGGGAPIGGGLIIMMALGAAYGSKKLYKAFK